MSLDIDDLVAPKCHHCGHTGLFFSRNITHNVNVMWEAAGCYDALYESHGRKAADILPELEAGLAAMLADPAKYRAMNPSNGWGTYEGAIEFLEAVIEAAKKHHDAVVEVSR